MHAPLVPHGLDPTAPANTALGADVRRASMMAPYWPPFKVATVAATPAAKLG
jgi:hypothetical protein